MRQILFENILNNNYLFITPATFIVPAIELIMLYLLASVINHAIKEAIAMKIKS